MFKKFAAMLCVLAMLLSFAGCGEVTGEIVGNVAEAAKKELENQVKATFEKSGHIKMKIYFRISFDSYTFHMFRSS